MADSDYLLVIDVGNTNTKVGVARNGQLMESYVLPTTVRETSDTFGLKIFELCRHLRISPVRFKAWLVSSVVPPVNTLIKQAGERYSRCPVFLVPEDIGLPLTNAYANPNEVGADRLVTAFAARKLFDTPGLIVIDFGTATTVECVQGWTYQGGLICPGVLSSLQALGGKTAKLPRVGLEVKSLSLCIGDSTETSMKHGFVFGFAAMIEGLCTRLRAQLDGEVTVVATGGFAATLEPVCSCLDVVQRELLLQGLIWASEGYISARA
jgi:type III pantothenate kinase